MLKVGGLNDFNQLNAHSNTIISNREAVMAPFYSSLNVYSLNSILFIIIILFGSRKMELLIV